MKSYTDINQSKKLAEFLPLESADMYYYTVNGDLYKTPNIIESGDDLYVDEKSIPCWSLAALLKLIPKRILRKDKMHHGQTFIPSFSWEINPTAIYSTITDEIKSSIRDKINKYKEEFEAL